jgi:hypothetical protein
MLPSKRQTIRLLLTGLLVSLVAVTTLSGAASASQRVTVPAFKQRGEVALFRVAGLRGTRLLKAVVRDGRRYHRVSRRSLQRGVRRGVLRVQMRRRRVRPRSRASSRARLSRRLRRVGIESNRKADRPTKKKKSKLSVVVEEPADTSSGTDASSGTDTSTGSDPESAYVAPTGPKSTLVAPGSPILDDAEAAAKVTRSDWEPRPGNTTANNRTPTASELAAWRDATNYKNVDNGAYYIAHVTGNFTGTTDEILRWAAWKWGFDEDLVRAQAIHESTWYQSSLGDGGVSYGLMQLKSTRQLGTFPLSRDSTAFNVDYAMMILRHCYDGYATWR